MKYQHASSTANLDTQKGINEKLINWKLDET